MTEDKDLGGGEVAVAEHVLDVAGVGAAVEHDGNVPGARSTTARFHVGRSENQWETLLKKVVIKERFQRRQT